MSAKRIPRYIHYCWFGGNEFGPKESKCIESWRRFMPDYEIIRWDESNFDCAACDYIREAYEKKKWAFVSDYVRLKVMLEYGGLYFDTDVELIAPIDDILERGPFMGFEEDCDGKHYGAVAPGLGLGAYPGMDFYRRLLKSYELDHFINCDGSLNLKNVVERTTELLIQDGLSVREGIQVVDDITIYPASYFNPKDQWSGVVTIQSDTRSIHHFGMSWVRPSQKLEKRISAWLISVGLAMDVAVPLSKILAIICCLDFNRVANLLKKAVHR